MNNSFSIFKNTCDWLKAQKINFTSFESTDSTNDQAKHEAFQINKDLKIYITATQSAGRGRNKNHWLSTKAIDSLLCSLSFHLPAPAQAITGPLIGLSLYESLNKIFPAAPLSLKAPNDIYLGDKKALGVLIESLNMGEATRLIIGIGLNVFSHPADLPTATHLASHCDINAKNWHQFLTLLIQNLMLSSRSTMGAHLTLEQREKILKALNKNPNLQQKYISVSPFGDLMTETETFSWRDL